MSLNWVEQIVQQHNELESPESFWYWSAVCSISATVKDNIWINRQIYNLYPNIYVMLHADSGLKKGPPVSMARQLVSLGANGTKIISGRSSIQGILKDLGTTPGHTQPGGKIVKGDKSTAFICSSELSSSIVEDKVAIKILTDLFDRQYNVGEWRSLLKMETFSLKDPTLTMLTATNEAMTKDFFTAAAIQGGYFARTFIVYEKQSENVNSLSVPLINPPNLIASAEYLKKLSALTGPFQPLGSRVKDDIYHNELINMKTGIIEYFSDVGLIYEEWYRTFKEKIRVNQIHDSTGTLNRFGDSVLKVAMLLALARSPDLVIPPDAMTEAIARCEKLLGNVRQTTLGFDGLSASKEFKVELIRALLAIEGHAISRTNLMQKMMMHYSDADEFDKMIGGLEQSGIFKYETMGNQTLIKMPEGQVEEWLRYFSGKKL